MKQDPAPKSNSQPPLPIANRRELFVDDYLIETLDGTRLLMHRPLQMPLPRSPFTGAYMTVLKDGDRSRGYARHYRPDFTGEKKGGSRRERSLANRSKAMSVRPIY